MRATVSYKYERQVLINKNGSFLRGQGKDVGVLMPHLVEVHRVPQASLKRVVVFCQLLPRKWKTCEVKRSESSAASVEEGRTDTIRAVSWMTKSRQLGISWLGNIYS